MFDLEEIRKKLSLVALAEEAGAKFQSPHHLRSHCPMPRHQGDRSSLAFSIYDNQRRWKCHSTCPADANGGDIFSFYMAWKGVDFKRAVEELAFRTQTDQAERPRPVPAPASSTSSPPDFGMPSPAWKKRAGEFIAWTQKNLVESASAQSYLIRERGISAKSQTLFRLGFNPKNIYEDAQKWGLDGKKIWLPRGMVIPGFWQNEPIYIKIRRPQPEDILGSYIGKWRKADGLPDIKFGGPRGGRVLIFRPQEKHFSPILFLTEGEWDAILLREYIADFCDVGALGGAVRKFRFRDLSLLTRYQTILVVLDKDKAGEKGREYIQELAKRIPRIHALTPPAHDLTDYWKSGGDLHAWAYKQIEKILKKEF